MSTTSARALGLASTGASVLAVTAGALASFGVAGLLIGTKVGAAMLLASAACGASAWRLSRPRPVPPIRFLDDRRVAATRARRAVDSGRTRLAASLHRLAYVVAPSRD